MVSSSSAQRAAPLRATGALPAVAVIGVDIEVAGSEPVKYSGASERVLQTVPV